MFQKIVVTSSFYNWFTGSISICLENDSSIILKFAEHTEIKADILFISVNFENFIDFFQPFYRFDCTDIVCQTACFLKNFRRTKQVWKFQKSFFQRFRNILAAYKIFYTKIVFLRDQGTEIFFFFDIQIGILKKRFEIVNLSDTDLKFF